MVHEHRVDDLDVAANHALPPDDRAFDDRALVDARAVAHQRVRTNLLQKAGEVGVIAVCQTVEGFSG